VSSYDGETTETRLDKRVVTDVVNGEPVRQSERSDSLQTPASSLSYSQRPFVRASEYERNETNAFRINGEAMPAMRRAFD